MGKQKKPKPPEVVYCDPADIPPEGTFWVERELGEALGGKSGIAAVYRFAGFVGARVSVETTEVNHGE